MVPSKAIETVNREVKAAIAQQRTFTSRKRGPYKRYMDEERARIAKYAVEHGVVEAV